MAVSKNKTRVQVSMRKEALDLIEKFAEATNMTKSEFIEDVCLAFIKDVCTHQQKLREQAKKGKA